MNMRALRDHLQRQISNATNPLHEGVQDVELGLRDATETITDTQRQVTEVQRTLTAIQQAITALQASVDHQQHRQHDDDGEASVQGGGDAHAPDAHDHFAGQAGGRGNGGRAGGCAGGGGGHGFAPQHVCHQCDDPNFAQPVHHDEDGLGKPKFTMPKFVGSIDVEEYLNWELKVEKLWRIHEYTEDKKIKLASSEFDDYALIWWDNLVQSRIEDGYPTIVTWRAMMEELRARFVPHNYIRSLYDRLQNLKQGPLSVDDYFQEMELILQRAQVHEQPKQTMQHFLAGLNDNIKRIVRHH
jgi:hypothetical protein